MSVTSTGNFASARATDRPPKPPPMTKTCLCSAILVVRFSRRRPGLPLAAGARRTLVAGASRLDSHQAHEALRKLATVILVFREQGGRGFERGIVLVRRQGALTKIGQGPLLVALLALRVRIA